MKDTSVFEIDSQKVTIRDLRATNQELEDTKEVLEESRRVLSTLIGNLPGMAYRCRNDSDWTMEFASDGILDSTGYPASKFLNGDITYRNVVHPEDRAAVWERVQSGIRDRKPFKMVYRLQTSEGKEKWAWEQGCGVFSPTGQLLALEGFACDITEQKMAENKLKTALKELSRSNADLKRFASVASHDLSEPIRMISSYCQLINHRFGETLDPEVREYFGFVQDGAQRMFALINDLLEYSRVGRGPYPTESVDCEEIMGRTMANLEMRIRENNAEVITDSLPVLKGNGSELVQVFQNLISNAIKYRKLDVRPIVRITARREGADWLFSVKDNGIGIEPQYFEKIFVLFQRLHTKEKYPGTGIGLAICKKIIEQHRGRIWLESEPDAGSTFFFTLPGE